MSQPELLKKVVLALDSAAIDYMVTGSVASSLQGEPRLSHDIDIVIAIRSESIPLLLANFPPPDYHLDADDIREALKTGQMFNLIDVKEGDKVDFWLLTNDPFDRSRFGRKYPEEFHGVKIKVSSPEDSILMKLRWANLSGGSEKQFTDALRVYEVQRNDLDIPYIHSWAKTLDVESLWFRIQKEAQIL